MSKYQAAGRLVSMMSLMTSSWIAEAVGKLIIVSVILLFAASPATSAMHSAANVPELFAAIDAANQNVEPDSIALAADMTFTLTEQGLPQIPAGENLTILGNGAVIARSSAAGTPAFRLFNVAAAASLTLENMTLTGGFFQGGGATAQGGAILSQGDLTLRHVIVQNSAARGALAAPPGFRGANALGGGVYSIGSLTIENSTFQDNRAIGGNGGHYACGPPQGCRSAGDGGAGVGGGVYIAGGTATLRNSTVTHNTVQGGAGGQGPNPGSPGASIAGGIYVSTAGSALVYLDAYTRDHVMNNTPGTSPSIFGPFQVLPDQLPGDYNSNGTVDAADYVAWKKNDGTQAGYGMWRAHFGQIAGNGTALPHAEPPSLAVPEPSAISIKLISAACATMPYRRTNRRHRPTPYG